MAEWVFSQTSDKQGLRLIVAFLQLRDDESRKLIIDLTEKLLAMQLSVEPLPAFPLLTLPQDNSP